MMVPMVKSKGENHIKFPKLKDRNCVLSQSRDEIQCYNCNDFGHSSRDCPRPNLRWNRPKPENESADPSGQSWP
jgi:hypothetical protein